MPSRMNTSTDTLREHGPGFVGAIDVDFRTSCVDLPYYYLLTSRNPAVQQHRAQGLPNPSGLVPAVPEACDTVVRRLTERIPANRFQSAEQVVAALQAIDFES